MQKAKEGKRQPLKMGMIQCEWHGCKDEFLYCVIWSGRGSPLFAWGQTKKRPIHSSGHITGHPLPSGTLSLRWQAQSEEWSKQLLKPNLGIPTDPPSLKRTCAYALGSIHWLSKGTLMSDIFFCYQRWLISWRNSFCPKHTVQVKTRYPCKTSLPLALTSVGTYVLTHYPEVLDIWFLSPALLYGMAVGQSWINHFPLPQCPICQI